jgi:hypothetical protein
MTTPTAIEVNCTTGEVIERPLTAEEIAANEAAAAQAEADRLVKATADAAAATAKAGAVSKLKALGLTDSEIAAFNA